MSSSETRFVGALNEELRALGRTGHVRRFATGDVRTVGNGEHTVLRCEVDA